MVTVISWTSCTKSKYIYRTFFYTAFITTFTDLAFLLTLHMMIYWTWLHTKINNICMSDPNPVAFQNSCSMYTILYIYIYLRFSSAQSFFITKFQVNFCDKIRRAYPFLARSKMQKKQNFLKKKISVSLEKVLLFICSFQRYIYIIYTHTYIYIYIYIYTYIYTYIHIYIYIYRYIHI